MHTVRLAVSAIVLVAGLGLVAACGTGEPVVVVGSGCAPPAYPSPACTGVPAGVRLQDLPLTADGTYVASTPGQKIDNSHIAGDLLIKADDVAIRDSQIDGTVYNDFDGTAHRFTITDSTVGPANGCVGQPGLNDAKYTATRVRVRGHDDGFRVSPPGNVTVRDSFAQLCYRTPAQSPPDGSHSDGIQAYCPTGPCSNVTFVHNTVDSRGVLATFMINLDDPALIAPIVVSNNLLAGGGYTIVTHWRSGPPWTVHDNNVVDHSWAYGPQSAEGTCSNIDWTGNKTVAVDDSYRVTSVVGPLPCVG